MKRFAYVGCRTTRERDACGNGIEVFSINDSTGEWKHVETVETLENPSYLTFDKTERFLYVVHGDTTKASAFCADESTGKLEHINTVDLGGSNPVYILPDRTNSALLIACLGTGDIVSVRREEDGSLGPVTHRYMFDGNEGEKKMTCPHQIYYDRKEEHLFVSLKGIKKTTIPALEGLAVFSFCPETGFEKLQSIKGRNFDHCRQVTLSPDNRFVYMLNELQSVIVVLDYDEKSGEIRPFQVVQTLPESCVNTGRLLAGTICCTEDGAYLYASNRGHDSIAMFSVDKYIGHIRSMGWVPTMGRKPRFICIDPTGQYVYAANEESSTIAQFRIENNGMLTYTNYMIKTGSPVCIAFKGE